MQNALFASIRRQLKTRLFEDQNPRRNSIILQAPPKQPQKSQSPGNQPLQVLKRSNSPSPTISKTFSDLSFEDEWECLEYIGQGAHAVVKKCRKKINQNNRSPTNRLKEGAVKIFRTDDPEIVNTIKETFNLNRLLVECRHVIKAYDLYIDENKQIIHLIMEYCDFRTLESLILEREVILPLVQDIMEQMAVCVEFMHLKGIAHRDLKPDNILVQISPFNDVEVKIIDFGVSKKFLQKSPPYTRDMWTRTGTIFYQAPEIFEGGGYDKQVDMWSIGVMLYQMLCGRLPYQCDTIIDTITLISEQSDCYENDAAFKNLNHLQQDLLKRLLKKNPEKRLTATELKQHPWMKSQLQSQPFRSSSPIHPMKCKDDLSVLHHREEAIDLIFQSSKIHQLHSNFSQNISLQKWDQIKLPELEEEDEEKEQEQMRRWREDFTDHIHYVKREKQDYREALSMLKLKRIMTEQAQGSSQEIKLSPQTSQIGSPESEAMTMIQFFYEDNIRRESMEISPMNQILNQKL